MGFKAHLSKLFNDMYFLNERTQNKIQSTYLLEV
jgi:hypothetical protein